jgi:hypothetical protein
VNTRINTLLLHAKFASAEPEFIHEDREIIDDQKLIEGIGESEAGPLV